MTHSKELMLNHWSALRILKVQIICYQPSQYSRSPNQQHLKTTLQTKVDSLHLDHIRKMEEHNGNITSSMA